MIKVLLVEDNPADARILIESLKEPGPRTFVVTRAARLAEAIDILKAGAFDVVLLDLTLPDSTGLETVRRLRAVTRQPMVVLTGMQDEELGLQAVREGVQDYLVKGEGDPGLTARAVRYAVERSRVEDELRDREARLRAIVQTAADAILIFDQSGTIESANPAANRLFGYSDDRMVGLNMRKLLAASHAGHPVVENRADVWQDASLNVTQREMLCVREDGSTFPVLLSVSRFEMRGKSMYTAIVHDVSNRRRLEREVLDAAAAEQRRIARDLHDGLCQHLLGTSLAAEVLARRMAQTAPADAASVAQIAEQLRDSIGQARALSHNLNPIDARPGGLLASLQDLVDRMSSQCGIRCDLDHPDDLPDVDAGTALHLYRITQEAMSNAIRHGKAGQLSVQLSKDAENLVLAIRDNGVGMSSDAARHGMGLHTMAHRARVLGGRLEVERAAVGGTIVTCSIPLPRGGGAASAQMNTPAS